MSEGATGLPGQRYDPDRTCRALAGAALMDRILPSLPLWRTAEKGRVGMWRGGVRSTISVAAPFVWRCLSGSAITPFPHPAHRTQQADFPHCALGQDSRLHPRRAAAELGQTHEPEVPVEV